MLKCLAVVTILVALAGSSSAQWTYSVTQPNGPGGALHLDNLGGTPGNLYLNAMTLVSGGFPFGWFYGIDIPFPDLIAEVAFGQAFFGALDAEGEKHFVFEGPIASGVTAYIVAVELSPAGVPLQATGPFTYVTL
jgi:hypothetical protein